jgi:hypothetical protein
MLPTESSPVSSLVSETLAAALAHVTGQRRHSHADAVITYNDLIGLGAQASGVALKQW